MLNKGVVTEARNGTLTVVFDRPEACGDCHHCPRGSDDCKKHTVYLKGDARLGDMVEVEMDDSHVVMASMIAYLIPLAGFLAGMAGGWALSGRFSGINPELVIAVFALAGTVIAYLVMRILDPHFAKGRWEPKIVSVLPGQTTGGEGTPA